VLPAVDVGKSVSRVGGKAQLAAYRAVAGDLKLAYAQFEELEAFARFGSRLDDGTRRIIEHGERIRACLQQSEFERVSVPEQIVLLKALASGLLDTVPLDRIAEAERLLVAVAAGLPAGVLARLESSGNPNTEDHDMIVSAAERALAPLRGKP
jgi:F-type H+-transporting ATPase subunit alpha